MRRIFSYSLTGYSLWFAFVNRLARELQEIQTANNPSGRMLYLR